MGLRLLFRLRITRHAGHEVFGIALISTVGLRHSLMVGALGVAFELGIALICIVGLRHGRQVVPLIRKAQVRGSLKKDRLGIALICMVG